MENALLGTLPSVFSHISHDLILVYRGSKKTLTLYSLTLYQNSRDQALQPYMTRLRLANGFRLLNEWLLGRVERIVRVGALDRRKHIAILVLEFFPDPSTSPFLRLLIRQS